MKFTEEQQTAIDTRNTSLLLSAAAGSGKTTVLVERIIQRVLSREAPVDVDRILVVTFTKAAASSMKEKLQRELKKQSALHPSDRNLKKQLLALQNASITTVHSFCSEVVKNNLHLLGGLVPANYRLLSEAEGNLLQNRAAEQVLEEYYESGDLVFEQVVEAYSSNKNDDKLQRILLDIYRFLVSMPYYADWFEGCFSHFEEAVLSENNLYMKLICRHAAELFAAFGETYRYLIDGEEEKLAGRMEAELSGFQEAERLAREGAFFALAERVNALTVEKPKKDSYREFAAKQIETMKNEFFCHTQEQMKADVKQTLPLIRKIAELVLRFDKIFRQLKTDQNAIDFNDLEHLAIRVLSRRENGKAVPTEAALSYREKFVEVMVDEYQDTNDVQEEIFRMVSRNERNLFAVGDVKQSIYRFRQANPDIFLNRSGGNEKKDWAKTIYLTQNFRCRKDIVDLVNFVFDDIMEEKLSSIPYRESERLVQGASFFEPENPALYGTEILLCHKERKEEAEVQRGESEGILIAKRIQALTEDEAFLVEDGGEKRRLRYKDIAILVRSVSDQTRMLADTLIKNHIPVNFSEKKPLLESAEVKGLFAYLEVLDNPYHDVAMIAVLKQFFRLSNEQLLELRLRGRNKHFYELLQEGGYASILQTMDSYRKKSFQKTVYELLTELLKDTGYLAIQTACPNGMERRANLQAFLKMAKEFEENGFRGLCDFVSFIRGLMESPAQDKHEIPVDEERDAVRIMTIHKSKGLEFPVVILAHADKKGNNQDLNKVLLFHRNYGIGFDYIDVKRRFQYPTLMKNAVRLKIRQEQTAEELRLLYVALTRAREKLIITADVPFIASSMNRWNRCVENAEHRIQYDGLFTGNSYLDFLIPPLLRLDALQELHRSGEGIVPAPFLVSLRDYTYMELEHIKKEQQQSDDEEREVLLTPAEGFALETLCDIRYPFRQDRELPRKISVSEIRRIQTEDHSLNAFPVSLYTPVFFEKRKTESRADYGTMVHQIFEWIDIKKLKEGKDIDELLDEAALKNPRIQLNNAVRKGVRDFYESELGKALLRAEQVRREQDFLIRLEAREIYPDSGQSEKIMVQGIIDCYFFRDESHVVLIDYKNSVKEEAELKREYAPQIEIYQKALRKILGEGISIESYLWDVNRGKSIAMGCLQQGKSMLK